MTNIVERAIIPYNTVGAKVVFNNQYHLYAPVAGINKVGMAGFCDDFSISTGQIVSISDKFKASGLQYTDVSNLPANIVYATDGVKSPNVVFSGYEHAVQDPTPGNTGNITVKGSLLTTYSDYTDTNNYSMNEILFADGRIWFRELNIVSGIVESMTDFKISYSKDEVDSYFRTKGDSYTITQINALLALKVNLAGAETFTGKKTFAAGAAVNPAPSAGTDVVNKTYADSKVPKTAIKTSVSGTPLDSNVLSEKFVNTTYRTKADSWSKADLDTHIGALETRVGNEVLSASLPGNEFGQGTLSGIINTLGSHIDSLQLGFVPRTMRNVITPLRSKNPTDLSTTDSYDELIALSEAGFVPDIPVGQTMTLVDRLNAFVLADQGRAANHTDAVVCVDIQAPDRGRLITYYYWDLGSGDEYEGVPAGWYVADVNMSPDNITNIGAFTKLLSKTPVGYEDDSTGTRVFAVNGSWKKYSAADLHAIYPTLEYLGLLDLWFIILAPDVDTMNTINNYEPGKSVALVDSSHGMGIDSAISIELLKKVKDVESGSLIQNIQYCKLDQFHVLSNGLVVLYTDDPFDGEVVIKTGKAYYVSGATEMMAVPMSQVTGLELALDSKVALVDGDIQDTVTTFEEASARANIGTGESTATLFGKIKKWYTDLKTHAFTTPSTTQGTGTTTVPSDKLLKDSSFARVYRSLAEINATFTEATSMVDVITGMANNSVALYNIEVDDYANTPYPLNDSTVKIEKFSNNRNLATVVRKAYNSIDNVDVFTGSLCGDVGNAYRWSGWKGTYRSPSQIPNALGTGRLPTRCSVVDLLNAIIVNNMYGCNFNICFSSATEDKVTGLPEKRTYGMLNITVPADTTPLRMKVEFNSEAGNGVTEHYIGVIKRSGATVVDLVWKKIKTGSLVSLGGASATSGKYIRFARVSFAGNYGEVSGVFLVYDNNHLNYDRHTCVLTLSCLTGSTTGPVANAVKVSGMNIDESILNEFYVSFNPTYSGTSNTFDFYYKQSSTYSSIVVEFLSSSARNNTTEMNPVQNHFDLALEYDGTGALVTYETIPTQGEDATFLSKISTLPVYFPVSPLVPTTPSGPSAAAAKSYVDGLVSKYNYDGALDIDWKNTNVAAFDTAWGTGWGTVMGYKSCRANSAADTSGTISRLGFTGAYHVIIITLLANWHTVILTDGSGNSRFTMGHMYIGPTLTDFTAQFYDMQNTNKDQTITGVKTFATGATPLITDAPTTALMAANKAYVDSRNMINYTSFTDVNASYTNETSIATLVGSMGNNTRFSGVFTSALPTSVYPRSATVYRLYIEKFSSDYAVVNLVDLSGCREYYMTKKVSTWSSWQSATTEENEWWSSADSTPFTGTGIIDFYIYRVGCGYDTLRMIRPATNVECRSTPVMMYYSSKLGLFDISFTGESNVPQTRFWPFDGTGVLYPTPLLRARVQRSNNTYDVPIWNQ